MLDHFFSFDRKLTPSKFGPSSGQNWKILGTFIKMGDKYSMVAVGRGGGGDSLKVRDMGNVRPPTG